MSESEVPQIKPVSIAGSTPESLHRMEIVGWILFVVWAGGLVAWAIIGGDPYRDGWRLVLELALLGGRAVNIADGVSSGFSRTYLMFQCGLQDVVYTLVVYPWIVRLYLGVTKVGRFGRIVDGVRKSAEKHSRYMEPFGGVGLWLFLFFPFLSTGVLNGSALGFILGMRTWVILSIVLSSHLISVVTLIFFFEQVSRYMDAAAGGSMRYLPWIVIAALLVCWLGIRIVGRLRR